MTDQEFISKVSRMVELTEDMDKYEKADIRFLFIPKALRAYLSDKTEIKRDVYNFLREYLNGYNHIIITMDEEVSNKCRDESEEIRKEIRRIEKYGLHIGEEVKDICWSLTRCREYIPKDVRETRIFNNFELAWEERVYCSDRKYGHVMSEEDFKELEKRYTNILKIVVEASHKFFEKEGYYELKHKLDEFWKPYRELSSEEREREVSILEIVNGVWRYIKIID